MQLVCPQRVTFRKLCVLLLPQEMGFSWAQSTEALKAHPTLEEAVEALFARNRSKDPGGNVSQKKNKIKDTEQVSPNVRAAPHCPLSSSFRGSSRLGQIQPAVASGWQQWRQRGGGRRWRRVDRPANGPSTNAASQRYRLSGPDQIQIPIADSSLQEFSQTVSGRSRLRRWFLFVLFLFVFSSVFQKWAAICAFDLRWVSVCFSLRELFSVWVGTLGPAMTYPKLHELFSRWVLTYFPVTITCCLSQKLLR